MVRALFLATFVSFGFACLGTHERSQPESEPDGGTAAPTLPFELVVCGGNNLCPGQLALAGQEGVEACCTSDVEVAIGAALEVDRCGVMLVGGPCIENNDDADAGS